ncbi:cyclin-D6-1-like isoform X3 [Dioscorea cayenensis subsp. rotundata]|nr:cyclin-D6-1-like isoform X3 [Dioscorea cayenensis subsp. rotundata]XP_039130271.1 cyclin-D6-1-like isoform X3 [Dioscorea cayenensis subsp. rotundata]
MEFDLENPLTSSDSELDSVSALFSAESDHMSSLTTALDLHSRRQAISLILQVQAQCACNVDPFMAYLAINYVDRYLARHEIPREKPWAAWLLAASSLSLASKMKKSEFSFPDFQMEEGFIFDEQTIHRMELLVLGALDWRVRSITPFSFLRFFLSLFSPAHPPLIHALKDRALRILLKAQIEIKMLEFKPSLIAASALISAAGELFPIQSPAFSTAIFSSDFVNQEKLKDCCLVMREMLEMMTMDGCDRALKMVSSCSTPATVLGGACPSSDSERTVGSSMNGRDVYKDPIEETPPPSSFFCP